MNEIMAAFMVAFVIMLVVWSLPDTKDETS